MEDQKSPDSHVEHLHAPTGEEYAVVEKKKHPKSAQPTESQALYQVHTCILYISCSAGNFGVVFNLAIWLILTNLTN